MAYQRQWRNISIEALSAAAAKIMKMWRRISEEMIESEAAA